jgi:hypothetical protein
MGPSIRVGAWVIFPSCRLGDRATLRHPCGSLCSWPVCHNWFPPSHWPATGVVGHNYGCHVDGPLNLPPDQSWAIPSWRVPQAAGHMAVGVLFQTLG